MSPEELRETFDHYDADGNGHIDQEEFIALMRALDDHHDEDLDEDELAMGFASIDADGNGTIEFGEFKRWWTDLL